MLQRCGIQAITALSSVLGLSDQKIMYVQTDIDRIPCAHGSDKKVPENVTLLLSQC